MSALKTRLAGVRGWPGLRKWALAFGLGALAGTALPPFGLWPLGVLGYAAGFWLFTQAASARQAALIGWGFGSGYFALTLHWIVEPFMVDFARHFWMAPFALLFLCTGLAMFFGLAFYFAYRIGSRTGPVARALVWSASLTCTELARSYVLTGFPWALVAQLWLETGVLQWLRVIGPIGLTLLTLLALSLPLAAWGARRLWQGASLLPLVVLGAGAWALHDPADPAPADAPLVRLVQPNAPQHQRWDPDHIPIFFSRQVEFTAAPSEEGVPPDLIVWSETSLPYWFSQAQPALDIVSDASRGVPVILGLRRDDGRRFYNSAILLEQEARIDGIYDKHHLVPFGEYMPFGDLLAGLGIYGLAAQSSGHGFSSGPGPALIEVAGIGPLLPLICYEAVFPQDVFGTPARPRALLHMTNDAWFGNFSGPFQHLAQARMRAIEQGVPMLRAANTGVSGLIDARGKVIAEIALNRAGFIDVRLPDPMAPTLYSRTGDWPAAILALGLLFGIAFAARVRGKTR